MLNILLTDGRQDNEFFRAIMSDRKPYLPGRPNVRTRSTNCRSEEKLTIETGFQYCLELGNGAVEC